MESGHADLFQPAAELQRRQITGRVDAVHADLAQGALGRQLIDQICYRLVRRQQREPGAELGQTQAIKGNRPMPFSALALQLQAGGGPDFLAQVQTQVLHLKLLGLTVVDVFKAGKEVMQHRLALTALQANLRGDQGPLQALQTLILPTAPEAPAGGQFSQVRALQPLQGQPAAPVTGRQFNKEAKRRLGQLLARHQGADLPAQELAIGQAQVPIQPMPTIAIEQGDVAMLELPLRLLIGADLNARIKQRNAPLLLERTDGLLQRAEAPRALAHTLHMPLALLVLTERQRQPANLQRIHHRALQPKAAPDIQPRRHIVQIEQHFAVRLQAFMHTQPTQRQHRLSTLHLPLQGAQLDMPAGQLLNLANQLLLIIGNRWHQQAAEADIGRCQQQPAYQQQNQRVQSSYQPALPAHCSVRHHISTTSYCSWVYMVST